MHLVQTVANHTVTASMVESALPQPGMKHSVEWWGKGRGVSRIMRKSGARTGAQNPHTRGGRRAHGPMVLKDWSQKLNSKEANAARDSAIAATADSEKVAARGHKFSDSVRFPIVLGGYSEDGENFDIESLPLEKATKKFIAMMESIGLGDDLTRANDGRTSVPERARCEAVDAEHLEVSYWLSHNAMPSQRRPVTFQEWTLLSPRTSAPKIWRLVVMLVASLFGRKRPLRHWSD